MPHKRLDDFLINNKFSSSTRSCTFYATSVRNGSSVLIEIAINEETNKYVDIRHLVLLNMSSSMRFTRVRKYGDITTRHFIATDLHGDSLGNLVEHLTGRILSFASGLRVSIEMLRCIEDLHLKGYIHRNISPHSFFIRRARRFPVILDNLHFVIKVGDVVETFAGNRHYGSPNILQRGTPSFWDDIFSWYFSSVKLMTGFLPWTTNSTESFTLDDCRGKLPPDFIDVGNYILGSDPNAQIDFDFMIAKIERAFELEALSWNDPYEWEYLPAYKDLPCVSDDPPDIPSPWIPPESEEDVAESGNCC